MRLAMAAKEAAGRAGAKTGHLDRPEMLEERAQGCRTPLTEYMWAVDEETDSPREERVETIGRNGLLREPVARLWQSG